MSKREPAVISRSAAEGERARQMALEAVRKARAGAADTADSHRHAVEELRADLATTEANLADAEAIVAAYDLALSQM